MVTKTSGEQRVMIMQHVRDRKRDALYTACWTRRGQSFTDSNWLVHVCACTHTQIHALKCTNNRRESLGGRSKGNKQRRERDNHKRKSERHRYNRGRKALNEGRKCLKKRKWWRGRRLEMKEAEEGSAGANGEPAQRGGCGDSWWEEKEGGETDWSEKKRGKCLRGMKEREGDSLAVRRGEIMAYREHSCDSSSLSLSLCIDVDYIKIYSTHTSH